VSRRRQRRKPPRVIPEAARAGFSFDPLAGRRWPLLLAALILVFYWTPLTSPEASIQWDAVDTHYSPQKYFADRARQGALPFWTPYLFSGFPFLADPQVGAFYPLNWPFFLLGITPRAVQWELALHAGLACAGAFLLLRRLIENRIAALLGACAYGLSGFFAGHSSHVGIFQGASLSIRAGADYGASREGVLAPRALLLIVPAVWYMLGPAGGFSKPVARALACSRGAGSSLLPWRAL